MRVYMSISSEGLGHSSRALALARYLPKGSVVFGSYAYAAKRLADNGYPVYDVPQELEFVGERGAFSVGATILKNQARALGFNQIVQEEKRLLRETGATLVVADGRMAAVLAAEALHIPCVVVTNQSAFYPFFEQDSPLVKLVGHSFEWVMKLWLSSAEEIWIPDFPPPHTVCLPNLSGHPQVKKRTRFVGPLVAWKPEEITAAPRRFPDRKLVVVSLGGHRYREPLFAAVLNAARVLPDCEFSILSGFEASHVPENVALLHDVANSASHLKAADLVITQAGHSTAMELLTLGKPALVVPDDNQIEQQNNARRQAELGVASLMEYRSLVPAVAGGGRRSAGQENPLIEAIAAALNSTELATRAAEMAERACALDGARHAALMLEDYATRLAAYGGRC